MFGIFKKYVILARNHYFLTTDQRKLFYQYEKQILGSKRPNYGFGRRFPKVL